MLRGALVIAAKDLGRSARDRSALVLTIVAPLALAFILSTALGNADDSSLDMNLAVVDDDGGQVGELFRSQVLQPLERAEVAAIKELSSAARARELANDGDIAAAFLLPEGLSSALSSNRPAEIDVITDPESDIGAQVARSVAEGFAAELRAVQLSVAAALAARGEEPDPRAVEVLRRRAAAEPIPATITTEGAGSRQFDNKTFFAAGMAVFFLFFTTQFGAVSLLRERREGTLARLVASPVSRGAIVLGKALFTFVLGVASMVVLVLASELLLGASWGDPLGVAAMIVAGVFAAMGVQSLVTTLAHTDEQAAGYGSIVGVTLGLLGGTFFPLSQAPGFLATLSFATPHAWLMRGFGDLSGGVAGIGDIVPALGALLLFGIVTGTVALLRAGSLVVAR